MFGVFFTAEGLKTSLAATSEAGKAIVDNALPTVFPLEEKVRFSDDSMTSYFIPSMGQKTPTLATATTTA